MDSPVLHMTPGRVAMAGALIATAAAAGWFLASSDQRTYRGESVVYLDTIYDLERFELEPKLSSLSNAMTSTAVSDTVAADVGLSGRDILGGLRTSSDSSSLNLVVRFSWSDPETASNVPVFAAREALQFLVDQDLERANTALADARDRQVAAQTALAAVVDPLGTTDPVASINTLETYIRSAEGELARSDDDAQRQRISEQLARFEDEQARLRGAVTAYQAAKATSDARTSAATEAQDEVDRLERRAATIAAEQGIASSTTVAVTSRQPQLRAAGAGAALAAMALAALFFVLDALRRRPPAQAISRRPLPGLVDEADVA
jgi:hypothetical protein